MLSKALRDRRAFRSLILTLCLGGAIILLSVGPIRIEAQASPRHPTRYTITDLTEGTDDESWAWGINSLGQAVGASRTNDDVVPFYFDGYRSHVLPTLDEFGGLAYGINTRGDIVGYVSVSPPTGQEAHAVVYTNGELHDLGTLGGTNSFAYAVNDAGEVIGTYQRDEEVDGTFRPNVDHTFLYTPTAGIQPLNIPPSIPWAINNQGELVGSLGYGGVGAFLYALGEWHGLDLANASGINDSGWIVGFRNGGSGFGHAFLYRDGTFTDIHAPWIIGSSTFSTATGINSIGDVVGYFDTGGGGSLDLHAFLYSDGTLRDLNSLMPKNSGWWLQNATAINGVGQIVGYGMRNGRQRAFLLTPEDVIGPSVLRIVKGRTEINSSNRYSEDTVIRAEMVFPVGSPQAGQIDRTFQGEIEFSEVSETSYYDGVDGSTRLPLTVRAKDGIAVIVLSSVSVSETGAAPPAASVVAKCTGCAPVPVYPNATIPQWVDGNSNGFIDWLESWANDLLRQMKHSTDEIRAVARLVSRVEPTDQTDPALRNACGYFVPPQVTGGSTSVLRVSPNCGSDLRAHRRSLNAELSDTILHESRHVWQLSQVLNPQVDQDADGLRNSPPQFSTPIDPAGLVPVPYPAGCNYIEERCTSSFKGSGRDDIDDRLIVPVGCTVPNNGNVSSCAWELDAYAFGRRYRPLFP